MARVSRAFPVREPDDAGDFFRLSRQFAGRSGLLTPEVQEVLRILDDKDIPASMTMLGNGVFAYGRGSRELLMPFGEVYEFGMGCSGVRIVKETV
jgi:pantoate kinase